jgi:hypothetical protein
MPGKLGAALEQGGLVALDGQQVVRPLGDHEELGGVAVGLQRIGGDHRIGQVQVGQQWLQPGDLARCAVDLALGNHRTVAWSIAASRWTCRPSRRAPRRVLPSTATAPRRRLGLGLRSVSQAPMAAASASGSRRARVRRIVASAGTDQNPGASRRAPSAARTGWGASAAHSAIAASERAPVKTAAAVMARIATSEWRRPRGFAGRGGGQVAKQVPGFGWLQGVGVGELGEGQRDRG